MREFNIGGRNALAYWMHCRMKELNLPIEKQQQLVDQLYSNLQNKDGFGYEECLMAARLKGA
jgi:hypothetical protein